MGGEAGGGGCVVEKGELGEDGLWLLLVILVVLENGSGGGVVEGGVHGGVVSGGGHVVMGWRLVGCEEDVGGLAGSDHDDICFEWFGVRCVDGDHCQWVVGDGEEEFLIQSGVYDSEKDCLAGIHSDSHRLCKIKLISAELTF